MKTTTSLLTTLVFAAFLQVLMISVVTAQSATEAAVNEKCERCRAAAEGDSRTFGAENCRLFTDVCANLLSGNAVTLSPTDTEDSPTAARFADSGKTQFFAYLNGTDELFYYLTPEVRVLNARGKIVFSEKPTVLKVFTFDADQKIKSFEGLREIKSLGKGDNLLVVFEINTPENLPEKGSLEVEFSAKSPLKSVAETVKTFYKTF